MKFEDSIDYLVKKLRAGKLNPSAEVGYDLMSDALIWSDEQIAGLPVDEMGCLRAILHYRTSVILGEPDHRFRDLWDKLHGKFPEWIGFSADRCQKNEAFLQLYRKHKKASKRYIKKIS